MSAGRENVGNFCENRDFSQENSVNFGKIQMITVVFIDKIFILLRSFSAENYQNLGACRSSLKNKVEMTITSSNILHRRIACRDLYLPNGST